MDQKSKKGEFLWHSVFKRGTLTRNADGTYDIGWEKEHTLVSKIGENNRAMELSELIRYHNRLYACDDRTGLVYEVVMEKEPYVVPRWVLTDGNGVSTDKGFKCEWAAIKDDVLYFGSIGKEFTHAKTGEITNYDPMWIKRILGGGVHSENWRSVYTALRKATGTQYPGYMIHEAVAWSPVYRKWFFLPRRMSTEPYNDELDETRGTNLMIMATEDFSKIDTATLGPLDPEKGFSTFKFLPDNPSHMVALKTREVGQTIETYITVLSVSGEILMKETKVDDIKFEGLEFLPEK